jgi:hypothetical protein
MIYKIVLCPGGLEDNIVDGRIFHDHAKAVEYAKQIKANDPDLAGVQVMHETADYEIGSFRTTKIENV